MRGAVEGLEPAPGALEQLIARGARPGRRLSFGALVPVLATVAAVAIAVVAVVSLNHRRPVVAGGAAAPRAAQGLVAQLAVLRRPQRAADRLPGWAAARAIDFPGHGRLVPGLSRLVATVHAGGRFGNVRVYLVVMTPPGPAGLGRVSTLMLSPRLGDQAATVAVARGGATVISRGEPAALLTRAGSEQLGAGIAQGGPGDFRRGRGVAASVVPDGVASVKWVFSGYLSRAGTRKSVTVYPVVGGNTAVAPLTDQTGVLASATWYGANGKAIASFDDAKQIGQQQAAQQRTIQASDRQPVAPALTSHFGVFRLRANFAADATGASLPLGLMLSLLQPNPYGLNVGQARFVPYPVTDSARNRPIGIWVVPGRSGVTLLADSLKDSTTAGLTGYRSPLNGRFWGATIYPGGSQMIVGLVPDGNRTVTAVLHNGSRVTAQVIENVYSIYVSPHPRALLLRDASGRQLRIPLKGA